MSDRARQSTDTIALHALSRRQRRLLEQHLPLVWLVLRRHFRTRPAKRDPMDLHQTGCIALAEAITSHNPATHGDFPPFAMSRVRSRLSRHVHEDGLIRVPYIAQRRRKSAADNDRHHPAGMPRACLLSEGQLERLSPVRNPDPDLELNRSRGGRTLGDIVRDSYDNAMHSAISEMAAGRPEDERLLRQCAQRRWSIPDPDFQASYRTLAADLSCPRTTITRREKQLFDIILHKMQNDPLPVWALRVMRSHPAGADYVPGTDELAAITSMNTAGDSACTGKPG